MDDAKPTTTRRRWPLIAAGAFIFALLIACAWWTVGTGVYTDDQGIRVRASEARLRQHLWTAPQGMPETINSLQQEYEPALSPDGAELCFVRGKPGENADLFISRRLNSQWTVPRCVAAINTKRDELGPCFTPDGQSLLFYSDRPGGSGQYDLWIAGRTADGWSEPSNLGAGINSKFNDYSPAITPDGKRLFFASNRKAAEKLGADAWRATIRQGEIGDYDLYSAAMTPMTPMTRPATRPAAIAFSAAAEVPGVNTPSHEGACAISPTGDFLYFASNRPGGRGGFDIYRARLHPSADGPLPPLVAESLGGEINSAANETDPRLAEGGFRLYFSSDRAGDSIYRLFTSESREVYAVRDRLPLPAIGWSWWLLLLAVALLVPLLMMLNGPDSRRLTLLQRCLLISLLLHILLTLLSTGIIVTRQIIASVRERQGDAMRIDLASAKAAEVAMQVRTQVTDLHVPTPAMSEIERIEMPDIAVVLPKPLEVKLPEIQRQPPAMQLHASTPPIAPPRPADRVELAMPTVKLDVPAISLAPPKPVLANRDVPKLAEPLPPTPAQLAPQMPASAQVTLAEVRVENRPTTRPAASLAQAAAIAQPRIAPAETSAPQAAVEAVAVAPVVREMAPQRGPVTAAGPDFPQVAEAAVDTRQQATGGPTARPSTVDLAVPAAAASAQSAAVAATVELRPVATVDKVAVDLPARAEAVEVTLPAIAPLKPSVQEAAPVAAMIDPPDPLRAQAIPAASAAGLRSAPMITVIPLAASTPRILASPVQMAIAPIRPVIPGLMTDAPAPIAGPLPVWARPDGLELPANLAQRSFEQRQDLLKELGGTPDSEAAVARALAYLARNQEPDGRWTNIERERWPGKRQRDEHDSALTALACLAYLGSDHTPAKPGPYQAGVEKALAWLVSIEKNGDLRNGGDMYDQGIATIALAEAALMTENPSYREAALRAGRFIERAIDQRTGGWRYIPGTDGDTSVLGWQLMALKSVAGLGQEMSDATRASAMRFLDSASYGRHRMLAAYQAGATRPSNAMAAEGAFCRILLGQHFTDGQRDEITGYLLKNLPGKTPDDYYYWYYASLALRQLQGEAWTTWNPHMRDTLVKLQQKAGALDGSWDFDKTRHGNRAGRVYSTAIATLTLEVYYRYLPMYNQKE